MNFYTDNRPYDVYLIGRYFSDLIFTKLPEMPRLGHEVYARCFHIVLGGVATPAIALTRLGLRVAWPCAFGSDVFSRHVKQLVLDEGVDSSLFKDTDHPLLALSVAFSFEKERAFLSYADDHPEFDHADHLHTVKPKWLYVTNLHTLPKLQEIVAAAREVGAHILMDCQAHHHHISDPQITSALRMVDVFTLNEEEARVLTGEPDSPQALETLTQYVHTVIIKRGASGCICRQGNEIISIDALPVTVVDTTGAGDNFNCGFLLGQLRDFTLAQSLRAGIICGSLSVQGYGGASTSPTLDELLVYMSS